MRQLLQMVMLVGVLGAGCKSEEAAQDVATRAKAKATSVGGDLRDKAGGLKDRALELGGDVKDRAGDVKDGVGKAADKVVDTAGSVTSSVVEVTAGALATGKRVKSELDKVYATAHDYEIAVDEVGTSTPAGEAHAKRLSGMPTVNIGDATVGYEEDLARSVGGVTRSKHFRASWRRGDKIVRVSFFTSEKIDAVAFAALLGKLVPIVERVL